MSVQVMGLVFDLPPEQFSCAQKMVLVCLADYANKDGSSVYPSKETVARQCSLDIRTVRKCMKQFEDIELLIKVAERMGMPTIYRIDLAKLRQLTQDINAGGSIVEGGNKNEGGTKMHPEHPDHPTPGTEARPPLSPAPANPSTPTNNRQEDNMQPHGDKPAEEDAAPFVENPSTEVKPAKKEKRKAKAPANEVAARSTARWPIVDVKNGAFEMPAPYFTDPDIEASMKDWIHQRMASTNKREQLTVRAMELATRWWSKYSVGAVAHAANVSSERGYRGIIENIAKEYQPPAAEKSIKQIANGRLMQMEERQRLLREAAAKVGLGQQQQMELGNGTDNV